MSLINSLEWRYATKKMNGQAVPAEVVEEILDAIRLSPSSIGLQPYTILVITDPEMKKQIQAIANNQSQITDGSHLLVFAAWETVTEAQVDEYIANTAQTRKVTVESLANFKSIILNAVAGKTPEQVFQWNARQAYIAFGTAIAAAAEHLVDATPMEGFNPAGLDELLNLRAEGLRSVALLALGYRDAENDYMVNAKKVRKPKDQLFRFHA